MQTMFHYLQNRSTYGHGSVLKGNLNSLDLSLLLPKLKNYTHDEYSTSDDDGMSVPPMACTFAKHYQNGNIVSVVDEDGFVVLYDINKTGSAAVQKSWQAHANAVFDLIWTEDDKQILTASGDQTIALWEVESNKKLDIFRGHTSSVKSVSVRIGDEAVFASGSRDGHVMIWDKRIYHKEGAVPPVDTIFNAHALQQSTTPGKPRKKKLQPKDGQKSVTSVVFQDFNYLVSCGAVDGCIKMWDIRKTYKLSNIGAVPVQVFHYPGSSLRKHGFSCLTLDENRSRLFASCTDDIIYEYNMKSQEGIPVNGFRGHKNSTFYIKTAISPDNQFLLSGSSDNHAYMWQINKPAAPPVLLKAHDAEVTSVAWCPIDLTKIVTLSDDAKTKFWRIYCRELKSSSLPPWLGRARRFSKERSTSMVETPMIRRQFKDDISDSPKLSPMQNSKSKQMPSNTPTRSLRDWLKRKNLTETPDSERPEAKISRNSSECKTLSPSTKESFSKSLKCKRSHSDSEANEHNPITSASDRSCGNSGCNPPYKKLKLNNHSSASSSAKSPPGTPKRSRNAENDKKYTSPRELFKRNLNSEYSPTKSPKRPCLTLVQENGQRSGSVDVSSVKVSLFQNENLNDGSSKSPSCSSKSFTENTCIKSCKDLKCSETNDLKDSSPHTKESITPSKQRLTPHLSDGDLNSPTQNLPNLVMDQMTNLRPTSPALLKSAQPKKMDWLTRFKLDKSKTKIEGSEKNVLNSSDSGSTKLSPKIPKSVKMKTIHSYFQTQNDK